MFGWMKRFRSDQAKWAAIQLLDLDPVAKKLREKQRWDATRITRAEQEYLEFLFLLAKHPKETMVPWSEDLDEFWHTHILDTTKYRRDCSAVFGRYIHHNPHLAVGTTPQRNAYERTMMRRQEIRSRASRSTSRTAQSLLAEDIGPDLIDAFANVMDAFLAATDVGASCGGHVGSSCGGGDSSSGASCGGASCGGASCGGSGCGGGCGGGCGS